MTTSDLDKALDVLGVPEKRGRGRPRKHENDAAKQAAYRERHDLETVTVQIPRPLMDAIREKNRFVHKTMSEIFVSLIEKQHLRKR